MPGSAVLGSKSRSRGRWPRPLPVGLVAVLAMVLAGPVAPSGASSGDHLEQLAPNPTVYVDRSDFLEMFGSAAGEVTAPVWAVDLVVPSPGNSTSGCQPEDFIGFTAGSVALIQRGSCLFSVKVANAQVAGATGVLVFNEGNSTRTGVFPASLGDLQASVPVIATSFAVGDDLRNGVLTGPTGSSVRVTTNGDGPTPAPPDEQFDSLVAAVEATGLREGTAGSLTAQLRAASAALDRGDLGAACNSLGAFVNHVEAQEGKELSSEEAAVLLAAASQLGMTLGC